MTSLFAAGDFTDSHKEPWESKETKLERRWDPARGLHQHWAVIHIPTPATSLYQTALCSFSPVTSTIPGLPHPSPPLDAVHTWPPHHQVTGAK